MTDMPKEVRLVPWPNGPRLFMGDDHPNTQGTRYVRTDARWRTVGEDGANMPAGAHDELLLCEWDDGIRSDIPFVLQLGDALELLQPGDRWVPYVQIAELLSLPGGESDG